MKQSLTSRVSRLITGSMNAIVDSVESAMPETVLEETIRELDGAIDDVRLELGQVAANKYLANTRLMEENRKHEELSEQMEAALKNDRDDLAEAAISRQLDIEAQIPILEVSISEGSKQEKELEGYIQALQARKREMRNELNRFRDSRRETGRSGNSSAPDVAVPGDSGVGVKVEKASDAFDRIMGKMAGLPASGLPAGQKEAAQLAELENLARKNRIQERLAEVKKTKGN